MKKRIAILGATGSIGTSALDVLRAAADAFEVVLLSSHTDIQGLRRIGAAHPEAVTVLSGHGGGEPVPEGVNSGGTEALLRAISECGADLVVNGIAGAAGLLPSVAALESGADLALANKETIVMAAPLVFSLAKRHRCRILPVDSEHSAIFHLQEAHGADCIDEVVLTASGGPFRGYSRERLERVRVEDALAHPTWSMGGKITIDSATLANKGLEVIEAVRLFDMEPRRVKVVVHPQSLVHSLVRLRDGSLYAQISRPDMRLPIHNALHWPRCEPCPFGRLDLAGTTMTFEESDGEAFPMLPLAYRAAEAGGGYPIAYNAADEVAVAAFISGAVGFNDIPRIASSVLAEDWQGTGEDLESILDADRRARASAERIIKGSDACC